MKRQFTLTVTSLIFYIFLSLVISSCAVSPLQERLEQLGKQIQETWIMLNTPKEVNKIDPTAPEIGFRADLGELNHNLEKAKNAADKGEENKAVSIMESISKKLKLFVTNYRKSLRDTVREDLLFASGKYDINDITQEGKKLLSDFSSKVSNELVKVFKEQFPKDNLKVIIMVVGYADATPPKGTLVTFLKNTSCLSDKQFEGNSSTMRETDAKDSNRKLSCLRAKSVKGYLDKALQKSFPHDPNLTLADIESSGLGEELPYQLDLKSEKPYSKDDQRRRICKIYAYVLTE